MENQRMSDHMCMHEGSCGTSDPERKPRILFYLRKADFGWLSNFKRAPQKVDKVTYPTNEHYYQAQKAADPRIRNWIRMAPNPHCAMIAGRGLRKHEMIKEWESRKVAIMYKGLLAKFTQNPELRLKLIETGNATLHEDSPIDLFWGKRGEDRLGKLLMFVRDKVKVLEKCPDCGNYTIDPTEDEQMCDLCGWAV